MSVIHERAFEDEICAHLAANGWLYSPTDAGFDKVRALFPEDLLAWMEETQPGEWGKVVKPSMSAVEQAKAREQLLDRLVKVLDLPLDAGGGTLNVLRLGFKKTPASFSLCQFRPNTTLNPAATARHEAVRLRVMRQVHYSVRNANSIDLVLFVNGLPVATVELKTDNVQSVGDAIAQYKQARDPNGEPLLGFGRCLVHFAVSNDEVWMTTRLQGKATHFLPFNRGDDGAAGNPVNPGGAATAYLWEQVLQRDGWLQIIGRLLHMATKTSIDPISGAATKSTTLLFPRHHQWQLVTRLLATVRTEGPGHRYLAQHSAGSGKTNSIAWTAHGLATLHDADNRKVFDTVIVITDRTVLDDQLQQAIKQIEGREGTVAPINDDEVRKAVDPNITSKSALLAKELLAGRLIVIVTLQTFPFALKVIRETAGLADKRFAIIADEAHSSQTGDASRKLREVLTAEERADLDDGGEIDTEAVLTAEMEARAESPNLSFFAFTATPKNKTLQLFGRPDADGIPRAFHVYSMQQAIEEGFILDVLRNYTTYDLAFRIAHQPRTSGYLGEVTLVDESEATKGLMRWVSLHPTNIAQKVQIIVEHYRANVRHRLGGHAKAMVVTSSREHAVRYKAAIDSYIAKRGYGIGTLVAFSGGKDVDGVSFQGVRPDYTEANLNPGLRGRRLPVAFGTDEFSVLIVANKYQTGFDQPLLCAMYVDKRLAGVAAVQTLSRLNRTYAAGGKDTTYVLDFVNDPDEILESFTPYYRDAQIESTTDPDIVHDLQAKLDAAAIYTSEEVEAFVAAFLAGKHNALTAPLKAAADRFNDRYTAALAAGDKTTVEELNLFRKDVGSFVRLYDFLSQIVNYADTGLEKRARFLRYLARRLTGRAGTEVVDLSTVELTHIKHARSGERDLDLGGAGLRLLPPVSEAGTGTARDPHLIRLEEVLAKINDLFAGEDFTRAEQQSWVEGLVTVLIDNDRIRAQAEANTRKQFVESPDLSGAVSDAVLEQQDSHNRMADYFFADERIRVELVQLVGELVHENLKVAG